MNKPTPLPRRCSKVFLLCCALAALLPLHQATAQSRSNDADRWYQVELIIFTQGGNPTDSKEIWRTDVELSYPRNWLELVDLSQAAAASEEDAGWEEVQESSSTPVELGQRALPLLPPDQLTMTHEAQRLRRSNQYRILFHGGWHQAMTENRQEPAILITGGDVFGDHYELEGSIQLTLRTYLHIDTNLWMSQFNTNFGQERQAWPTLPRRPNQAIEPDILFRIDDGGSGLWHQFNQSREYETILAQPYVVENILTLKRSQRMRSGEVHYIDHPKMGVLVKLIPYEPKEDDRNL